MSNPTNHPPYNDELHPSDHSRDVNPAGKLDIIMVRRDKATRKMMQVLPQGEYNLAELTPMFWGGDRYYTVPDYTAENTEAAWLAQFNPSA